MKFLLTDCGIPSQQLLTIKALLTYPIYGEQSEQVDNKESPTIVDILKKKTKEIKK